MKKLVWLPLIVFLWTCNPGSSDPTWLIQNVNVAFGNSIPITPLAVRIQDDRILEVGLLEPEEGEPVVDGQGLTLAPGFIDTHSHHDEGMFEKRGMDEVVSQGVTTIVVGQDGFSHYPIQEFWEQLDSTPVAVNVASYIGHNTLRRKAMGNFTRPAGTEEVEKMASLLTKELEDGGLGLSSGLEYDPGIYSNKEEVLALAKVAADQGRRYMSHIRSEDRYLLEAIQEIITIGKTHKLPVHISHMKLAIVSQWGKADSLLQVLESARERGVRITADIYPYEYWQSTMTVLLPERDFDDLEAARFALTELTTPEGMLIARYDADRTLVGKAWRK